jgi:hypothetical protein
VEKPNQPPGPAVADIIFWQVSGALIGTLAGAAFAVWTFGPNVEASLVAVGAGLVVGGTLGTLRGLNRRP